MYDLKEGQTVYLLKRGYSKNSRLIPVEIKKVGNKYFYIGNQRFYKCNLLECTEFGCADAVYLSEEDYHNELRRSDMYNKVSRYFRENYTCFLTTKELETIYEIVEKRIKS